MAIDIRDIRGTDSELIFDWRQAGEPLHFSVPRANWDETDHLIWFEERILRKEAEPFWIITCNSMDCGYLRFEHVDDTKSSFMVSILISKEFRGHGVGEEALQLSIQSIKNNFNGIRGILAKIQISNERSLRLFQKLGFELVSGFDSYEIYKLDL